MAGCGAARLCAPEHRRVHPHEGPSELGASGKLKFWDRAADLGQIRVPTLTIGATHDTTQFDNSGAYFQGLIGFLKDVDAADDEYGHT